LTEHAATTDAREPRLDRAARVEDGMKLLAIEPLLVNQRDDLFDIMGRAARQPSTRLVGVVDDDGRLVGVIRIRDLVEDVLAHTIPEALMSDLVSVDDVARFGHQVESHTAADAMLPPAAVRADASIVAAFRRMLKDGLSGVYVVDDEQRPTGYLDRLELACLATLGLPSTSDRAPTD
jgi:CBS domain-containing protein